jgi:hypothetical protein
MARRDTVQASRSLQGDDIETTHWENAHYWIGVYDDLLKFMLGLLDLVGASCRRCSQSQKAAAEDNTIIERQMEGY